MIVHATCKVDVSQLKRQQTGFTITLRFLLCGIRLTSHIHFVNYLCAVEVV